MRKNYQYIINSRTILFYPEFDGFGKLFTCVLDDKGITKVKMSPSELIDFNLKYYGSSLRGAGEGSGTIMGKINMRPVVINEMLSLYWFPSTSSTRNDCIWFAADQIKDYHSIDKNRTHVLFNDESTLIIDMSLKRFVKKVQRAYELKGKVESRTRKMLLRVRESKVSYHINKDSDNRNFDIREE